MPRLRSSERVGRSRAVSDRSGSANVSLYTTGARAALVANVRQAASELTSTATPGPIVELSDTRFR